MESTNEHGKVQWRRGEDGDCIPWVLPPGALRWMPYNMVPGHRPDCEHFSKGYPAFVGFLRAGYESVPMEKP